MNEAIRELLEKSRQSNDAAETLARVGYAGFAASRAYYAMFYAVEALLLSREQTYSKHSAVIAAFGKDFVKTGLFDPRFHTNLLAAFDLRNAGDYGANDAVSHEKADLTIDQAREFTKAVEEFVLELV